jgi:hypothetical protein
MYTFFTEIKEVSVLSQVLLNTNLSKTSIHEYAGSFLSVTLSVYVPNKPIKVVLLPKIQIVFFL